ncbi:MAG: ATP-binding protein, partial [Chromatiaceae bacterium]
VLVRAGRVASSPDDAGSPERVEIRVEDDGPGVPASALQSLGQRGLRLDQRRQGSGLGLAIVQDICEAYGATLSFAPAALGGLAVRLRLPTEGGCRNTPLPLAGGGSGWG